MHETHADDSSEPNRGLGSTVGHFRLLDLPELILDQISDSLYQTNHYAGYLCHLRLVNKQLNDIILRCLCRQQFYGLDCFWREHYMSCPGTYQDRHICRMGYCQHFGGPNRFYARILLRGRIQTWARALPAHRNHHKALSDTLDSLRTNFELSIADSAISLPANVQTTLISNSMIFDDVASIVLCSAVVELLTITDQWKATQPCSRDVEFYNRSCAFWQYLTLCYINHSDFRNKFMAPESLEDWSIRLTRKEFVDILTMMAFRGYVEELREALTHISLVSKEIYLILIGACVSGQVAVADMLLTIELPEGNALLCLDVLVQFGHRPCPPRNSGAVFQRLVDRVNPLTGTRFLWNFALITLVRIAENPLLRQLLKRLQGRQLYPIVRDYFATISLLTPVWVACVNGELESLQILLDAGYLGHSRTENDLAEDFYFLSGAAAFGNRMDICMELCRRWGKGLEEIPLHRLAALEGTEDIMLRILDELEKHPPMVICSQMLSGSYCRGEKEKALYRAIFHLRVANAALLLKRGVRTPDSRLSYSVEWRYKCKHEQAFSEMQELLDRYGLPKIELLL